MNGSKESFTVCEENKGNPIISKQQTGTNKKKTNNKKTESSALAKKNASSCSAWSTNLPPRLAYAKITLVAKICFYNKSAKSGPRT